MGTTNLQRMGDRKPHLVGENRDNSSRRKNDAPDKGSGQANVGIWSAIVGLKKPARVCKFLLSPRVVAGSSGHCPPERVDYAKWCISTFSILVRDHIHATYPWM
ncbi:hypothetical protein TNCV_1777211 [Trichonephila clavipes]|nr:hypothetical protein TNCV_1777211 [Trichonephila clavipes]